jgi:hypothetical protein
LLFSIEINNLSLALASPRRGFVLNLEWQHGQCDP